MTARLPFLFLFVAVQGINWTPNYDHRANVSWIESDLSFDGDIILPKNETRYEQSSIAGRIALRNSNFLWEDGVVNYQLHHSVKDFASDILLAMQEIESTTCVRFQERKDVKNHLLIFSGSGCYSAIGRRFREQKLSLNLRDCRGKTIALHELLHTLGFAHMHARFDRDKYVNVHWENILPSMKSQFTVQSVTGYQVFTDFDYDSVMLYGPTVFSKDGKSITISSKLPEKRIVDVRKKPGLSKGDIFSINRLYDCKR